MSKTPSKFSLFLDEITDPYLSFLRTLTPILLFLALYMLLAEVVHKPEFKAEVISYVNHIWLAKTVYYLVHLFSILTLVIMLSSYVLSIRSFYLKTKKLIETLQLSTVVSSGLWLSFAIIQVLSGIFIIVFSTINFYKIYDSLFLM